MKSKFLMMLSVILVSLSLNAVADVSSPPDWWQKPTDDKWVTDKNQWSEHKYHEGTVNEAMTRFHREMDDMRDDLNSGIAGAAALSGIPSTGTEFSVGAGIGAYRNGQAVAVGFSGNPEGSNVHFKVGVSFNNKSDAVMGSGVAYGF